MVKGVREAAVSSKQNNSIIKKRKKMYAFIWERVGDGSPSFSSVLRAALSPLQDL